MTRSSFRRILTTLWACWFVLLMNEPVLLHACPMHDGAIAALAAPATDAGEHASHHMEGQSGHGNEDGEQQRHNCSCLGDCASSSASTLPASHVPFAWLAGIIDVSLALPVAEASALPAVDYLLPFGNGPPALTQA